MRATLVLYESGPRLGATLAALAEGLGDREAAVTREITKKFEEAVTGHAVVARRALCRCAAQGRDRDRRRAAGRGGSRERRRCRCRAGRGADPAARRRKAAGEVAKKLGLDRKALYARALEMKG